MTGGLIYQKVIGFALVVGALLVLNPYQLIVLVAILGQGHFVAAYYYQWKAGKIGTRGISVLVVAAVMLLAVVWFTQNLIWTILIAALIFLVHHLQDEPLLFDKDRSFYRTLEQIAPLAVFVGLIVDSLFQTHIAYLGALVALFVLALYLVSLVLKKHRFDVLSAYFLALTAGLLALVAFDVRLLPAHLVGPLVLFHYVCWYVYYYFRFGSNAERRRAYVKDMLVINGIFLVLYGLFLYVPQLSVLGFLFIQIYFYAWTVLHILSSVRPSDYSAILKW